MGWCTHRRGTSVRSALNESTNTLGLIIYKGRASVSGSGVAIEGLYAY